MGRVITRGNLASSDLQKCSDELWCRPSAGSEEKGKEGTVSTSAHIPSELLPSGTSRHRVL